MISTGALAFLVYCALTVTIATPVVLSVLLIRDYLKGELW